MSIELYSGALMARTQAADVFDVNADTYFRWLTYTAIPGIDTAIQEAVALAAVTEYDNSTTYNLPDTVLGSDAMTYRCAGSGVVGDDPVGSVTGDWVSITLTVPPRLSVPTSVILTGGIIGGNYSKSAANEITFEAISCWDENNTTAINCIAQTLSTPVVINQIYVLFACSDGVFRTDTDEDGANLSAYTKRRIGFIANDNSGIIKDFWMNGDLYCFLKASDARIQGTTTSIAQLSLDLIVPTGMIRSWTPAAHGTTATASNIVEFFSDSSGNALLCTEYARGYSGDSDIDAWGYTTQQRSPAEIPYNDETYVRGDYATNTYVLARTMNLKR